MKLNEGFGVIKLISIAQNVFLFYKKTSLHYSFFLTRKYFIFALVIFPCLHDFMIIP